jgi:uncharacterized alpha/beta hydrolase family protein
MKYVKYLLLLVSFFVAIGCSAGDGTESVGGVDSSHQTSNTPASNNNPGEKHGTEVTNILFAHGFGGDKSTWDHFVEVTNGYDAKDWNIYRTDVSRTDSIATRASTLADYINAQKFPADSVVAVGHSMGGLDLRYIISQGNLNQTESNKYYKAAKTIHKVFTIATPHKGVDEAKLDALGLSKGLEDLKPENMEEFNNKYPYSTFSIDNRAIPMLAMRFKCKDGTDGTVNVSSQSLKGAPRTKEIFDGRHSSNVTFLECSQSIQEELEQDEIINGILDNKGYEIEIER